MFCIHEERPEIIVMAERIGMLQPGGVFLKKATVITVGQEYVINGQIVNAEIVN